MKEKVFCKNCKGLRNHKEIHLVEKRGGDNDDNFQWLHRFSIIECLGCENIAFLEVYGDTEMYERGEHGEQEYYFDNTVYPPHLKKGEEIEHQEHLPEKIKIIYQETISAFKSNSSLLTAGGLRAIIEAICNDLEITGRNLADRIDMLSKNGHLTKSESERLHSIRFLGNDALHEIEKPKAEHLFILLEIVNHLLNNLYVNDKLMEGKVEKMITKYEDFVRLIQNKIEKDMVGKEYNLTKILDKSMRLLTKENYSVFQNRFIKDIEESNIKFAKAKKDNGEVTFEIIEKPKLFKFGIS